MPQISRQTPKTVSDFRGRVFWLITAYVILSLLWLTCYRWSISPDTISYISIALKYRAGDLYHAVNGDWSPLISWLLVPLLWLGIEPLLAFHILSLFLGLGAIGGVICLCKRFPLADGIRIVILPVLVPMIISFHYSQPDLLLAGVLTYYFSIIFGTDYAAGKYGGLLSGLLGALAFLSKSYALPFFLSHFSLCNGLHYFACSQRQEKRRIFKHFVSGITVFSAISLVWLGALWIKYGEFTLGTSATGSHAYLNPNASNHGFHYKGFVPPPNRTATSAWEDAYFIPLKDWSPFASWNHFRHQLALMAGALKKTVRIYLFFSLLAPLVIVIFLLSRIPISGRFLRRGAVFPAVTIFLYSAGYILIGIVTERYLWPICILLLLWGGGCLSALSDASFFGERRKRITFLLYALSFTFLPVQFFFHNINDGKSIHDISRILSDRYQISGSIAANKRWHQSMYLAYHLRVPFYGTTPPGTPDHRLRDTLEEYHIGNYLVWKTRKDGAGHVPAFLSHHAVIADKDLPGLRIYRLSGADNRPPASGAHILKSIVK